MQRLWLSPFKRSLPNEESKEAVLTLRDVLARGSIPRDLENKGVKTCYELGWLHSESHPDNYDEIVCFFPTRLHAM